MADATPGQAPPDTEGEVCDVCGKAPASHKCLDCDQFSCPACTAVHASIKATWSHTVHPLPPTVGVPVKKERFCVTHKEEKLRFFCTQCCKVICRDCKLTSHEGHGTVDLGDRISVEAKGLIKKVTDVAKNSLEPKLRQVLHEAKTHVKQVWDKNRTILATLESRAQELKGEIDEILQKAKVKLNQGTDDVDKAVASCIDSMNLELASFLSLTEHAQRVARDGCDADVLEMTVNLRQFFGRGFVTECAVPQTCLFQSSTSAGFSFGSAGINANSSASKVEAPIHVDDSKLRSFTNNDWHLIDIELRNDCPFGDQTQTCSFCKGSHHGHQCSHGRPTSGLFGGYAGTSVQAGPCDTCNMQYSCSSCRSVYQGGVFATSGTSANGNRVYCPHRLASQSIPLEEVLPQLRPIISQFIGHVTKVDQSRERNKQADALDKNTYNINNKALSSNRTKMMKKMGYVVEGRQEKGERDVDRPTPDNSTPRQSVLTTISDIRSCFSDWQTTLNSPK